MVVPPEWSSLHVALPVTEVLDHPKRVVVNGQAVDTFKFRDIVNLLKPINAVQGINRLGIKLNSLLGYRRDCLDPFFIKVLRYDNDNVVAPTELRGDDLMLVQSRALK